MSKIESTSPGAALVAHRWRHTKKADRSAHGRAMAAKRWADTTLEQRREMTAPARRAKRRRRMSTK